LSSFFINFAQKLIPTMMVASIVNKKTFSSAEYLFAFCMCLGLVLFAAADWSLAPSFHPIGLAFVSLSVCADALLPNAQEQLFRMGSTRLEVTFYTNIFTLIAMTVTTLLSGDLIGLRQVLQESPDSALLCNYFVVYTFIAYIAISFHMTVVRRFGGVMAVLVSTGRKGMTLILSFIFFPKKFSWLYVLGALMVLGGLLLSSLHKIRNKKKSNKHNATAIASPRRNEGVGDEKNGILISPLLVPDGSAENGHDHEKGPARERHTNPKT
jgi:adenosine 3'-phospho 5'-phosphosulfate transporter B3